MGLQSLSFPPAAKALPLLGHATSSAKRGQSVHLCALRHSLQVALLGPSSHQRGIWGCFAVGLHGSWPKPNNMALPCILEVFFSAGLCSQSSLTRRSSSTMLKATPSASALTKSGLKLLCHNCTPEGPDGAGNLSFLCHWAPLCLQVHNALLLGDYPVWPIICQPIGEWLWLPLLCWGTAC